MNHVETRQGTLSRWLPRRFTGTVIVDIVLIGVLSYLLVETVQLVGGARRFPLLVVPVTLGLVVIDLALELFPTIRRRAGFVERDFITVTQDDTSPEEPTRRDAPVARQWVVFAWVLLLGFGIFFFGYALMTPIFLAAFFLWARVPLKVAAGVTLVMSALNYLVFHELLGYV